VSAFLLEYAPESTGIYDPDFSTREPDLWADIVFQVKKRFRFKNSEALQAISAHKNRAQNWPRSSCLIHRVLYTRAANRLATRARKYLPDSERSLFTFPGSGLTTVSVYLKHWIEACHAAALLDDLLVQKAISACKEGLGKMLLSRLDKKQLRELKPSQVFVHFYNPADTTSGAPWHQDVDTHLGSAIILLSGDSKDCIHSRSRNGTEVIHTLKVGEAFIMTKNVYHFVPARSDRTKWRIVLIVWL
jgi:hypothetical protein